MSGLILTIEILVKIWRKLSQINVQTQLKY